jgi:hypothetical protein
MKALWSASAGLCEGFDDDWPWDQRVNRSA